MGGTASVPRTKTPSEAEKFVDEKLGSDQIVVRDMMQRSYRNPVATTERQEQPDRATNTSSSFFESGAAFLLKNGAEHL
jgi:hypothetical protein